MNTIKFSYDFEKLPLNWEGMQAQLVQIVKINIETLDRAILHGDTKYRGKEGWYQLPFKEGLLLTFLIKVNEKGLSFSTIRRYTPRKLAYYKERIGQEFTLVKIKTPA